MTQLIKGLHHVTSKSSDPRGTDRFWRSVLGLRRIKQTVNFDNPKVYHLYYGNEAGEPGTVMTYFPFPGLARGTHGTGEVRYCALSVPPGSLDFWEARLVASGAHEVFQDTWFDTPCLNFEAPDGDQFRLVEQANDPRRAYLGSGVGDAAIRGFEGVTLTLSDIGSTAEILEAFGYQQVATERNVTRYHLPHNNGAGVVDLETAPDLPKSIEGAGSVHHIAFAVQDRAAQAEIRDLMLAAGQRVTHVYDRNYFYAIYFRTEGGVLFEVATYEPGFDADEDIATLGEALMLPEQHEHLREELNDGLMPLD